MAQSITLKIAGKEYPLKANSEEMEQVMRIAAETINFKLNAYDSRYASMDQVDKLVFVALNETVSRLSIQKKLNVTEEREKELLSEMENYLKGVESEK